MEKSGYDNLVVFVHIPKTAGTSLRNGFEQAKPKHRIIKHYSRTGRQTTSSLNEEFRTAEGRARIFQEYAGSEPPGNPLFLCGHFRADLYADIFPIERFAAFVRNPVDRVVSSFMAMCRRHGNTMSIEDYIEDPKTQNVQYRFLGGERWRDFGFIGLTESYKRDLKAFREFSGVKVKYRRSNIRHSSKLPVSENALQRIAMLNESDIKLYQDILDCRLENEAKTKSPFGEMFGRLKGG